LPIEYLCMSEETFFIENGVRKRHVLNDMMAIPKIERENRRMATEE